MQFLLPLLIWVFLEFGNSCLNSASFSFLINKQTSKWISSSRGVHQGNPFSSNLFIIVSQSMSTLLNFALSSQMIPCFNSNLRLNFNHLIYVDNLVLITLANINLYRSMYRGLIGQGAHKLKFEVYFPDRFNSRLKTSISIYLSWSAHLHQKTRQFSF